MKKPFPFIISPSQRQRLEVFTAGRRDGETEDEYVGRCNAVLTRNDRDLIMAISDYYDEVGRP